MGETVCISRGTDEKVLLERKLVNSIKLAKPISPVEVIFTSKNLYPLPGAEDEQTARWKNAPEDNPPGISVCVILDKESNTPLSISAEFKSEKKIKGDVKIKANVQSPGSSSPGENQSFEVDGETSNKGLTIKTKQTITIELGTTIDLHKSFKIEWEISVDSGEWQDAGKTDCLIYVPFKKPTFEEYIKTSSEYTEHIEEYLYFGCLHAQGADTSEGCIQNIWKKFKSKNISLADFGHEGKAGVILTYYKSHLCKNTTAEELLNGKSNNPYDGQCGAWAEVFKMIFEAQGLNDFTRLAIQSKTKGEYFLVNEWKFKEKNKQITSNKYKLKDGTIVSKESDYYEDVGQLIGDENTKYTHVNFRKYSINTPLMNKGYGWKKRYIMYYDVKGKKPCDKDYYSIDSEVTDIVGDNDSGQGNVENPIGLFNAHYVMALNYDSNQKTFTKLYDPSYGKTYATVDEIEREVIAGFMLSKKIKIDYRNKGKEDIFACCARKANKNANKDNTSLELP